MHSVARRSILGWLVGGRASQAVAGEIDPMGGVDDCSAAAAIVLSCILAVPVCCGLSMADESSSYIEVGPFSNSRRMGRGASLTVGELMQRTPPCPGDSIWAPLRSPRPSKPQIVALQSRTSGVPSVPS